MGWYQTVGRRAFFAMPGTPGQSVPKIISALTNALAESSGASPDHIQVVVQGIPAKHWGQAGKPGG